MTSLDITIERAGPADAAKLIPMVEDFYAGDEYETSQDALSSHLDRVLADSRSAIFIAEDTGNTPVGFVCVLMSTGLEFGTTAEIEGLYVSPNVRGKRIGSHLMVAAMEWCEAEGADEIFLVIAQQGEPARQLEQLYLRLGFEPSRRRLMYRPLG